MTTSSCFGNLCCTKYIFKFHTALICKPGKLCWRITTRINIFKELIIEQHKNRLSANERKLHTPMRLKLVFAQLVWTVENPKWLSETVILISPFCCTGSQWNREEAISSLFLNMEVKEGELYRFLFKDSFITSDKNHPRNRAHVFGLKLFSTDIIC